MKFLAVFLSVLLSVVSGLAGVELQPDGSYLLTGRWMYWPDKDILAPFGRFDRGEFQAIVFKAEVNRTEGVQALKNTEATLRVRAKINPGGDAGKVLVVTEILEINQGGPGKPPKD